MAEKVEVKKEAPKPKAEGGKKKPRKTKSSEKWKKYTVEGGKLVRKGKPCPKCGSGTFLAEHKDRLSCGKCHYMETRKK